MADYVADVLARAARRAQEAALRDACESSDDGDQTTERRPEIAWVGVEQLSIPKL